MIYRIKKGKGFCYKDKNGRQLKDPNLVDRIRDLRIPPAWKNVTISPDPDSRIQAMGFDVKGRKQYIYHAEYILRSNRKKFSRLRNFITALPAIRRRISNCLKENRWTREKTIALAVKVLDEVSIRIGNECYRKQNGSVGLTTLGKQHFTCRNGTGVLSFTGKSGKQHCITLSDELTGLLKKISRLPGEKLFCYRNTHGEVKALSAAEVNEFLKHHSEKITAKDFRTWKGTVTAVQKAMDAEKPKNKRTRLATVVLRQVSAILGNTLAICRDYYVHPVVLRLLEEESLPLKLKRLAKECRTIPGCFSFHEYLAARLLYRITWLPSDDQHNHGAGYKYPSP